MKKYLILIMILGLLLISLACNPQPHYKLEIVWLSDNEEAIVETEGAEGFSLPLSYKSDECMTPDKFEQMERLQGEYDSIIVKFKPQYQVRDMDFSTKSYDKFRKYGSFEPDTVSRANIAVVKPHDTRHVDWREMIMYYESLPEVKFAEPNYKRYLHAIDPNDPYYQYQWHMKDLLIPDVWEDFTKGDPSVIVAVLDSGVAYTDDPATDQDYGTAPDFQNTNFVQGYDFVNGDYIAYDDNSHGSHVAGTIAASENDGEACVGMAPDVTIMPFKVMSASGGGYASDTTSAIYKALEDGANIINMSLGATGYSEAEREAVNEAHRQGMILFASTGNEHAPVGYPAAFDNVVAVGASNSRKGVTYYSNYGKEVDIVAPGGDGNDIDGDGEADRIVQQTITGHNPHTGVTYYEFVIYGFQGTSMSCPHAVGLAALIKSHYTGLDNDSIESIMKNTADDVEKEIFNDKFGYGIINPYSALLATDTAKQSGIDKTYNHEVSRAFEYDKTIPTVDEHKINVIGGKIKISIYIGQDPPDSRISLLYDGDEVASSDEGFVDEGYIEYDTGSNAGEYTIKVEIEAE
jgi:subtilisin family serine protease